MVSRLLVVAVFCLGGVGLGSAAGAAETPAGTGADAYARAQVLVHDRRFRDAIAVIDPYLADHPRDARALVLRGDAKADLGDNEGALRDYNVAIGISPEYQYAYVTRCETRMQLEDLTGALADCDTAVRLDANSGLAYEDRADVQFQRAAYDLAVADYDHAVALGRTSAYVYAARCDANRLIDHRENAAADCRKALEVDPKSRRGLWANSRLDLLEARYADGIAHLNAYIALNPKKSDNAYYFRGFAFNRIANYRLALEDLETYVQLRSRDPDGYKERAVARYGVGDRDGALADLDVALRGYRKDGDDGAVAKVSAMVKSVRAGSPPVP